MDNPPLFDRTGYIVAIASLIVTFLIFFRDTAEFMGSLAAAIITAGLVWGSYVIIRLIYLAFLRK